MLYYLMAICAGVFLAIQAPINALLGKNLNQSPLFAALISFVVGSIVLSIIAYFTGALSLDKLKLIPKLELWKFSGGLLGAFLVFTTVLLAPKIGVANMFLFIIIAQLFTSMLIDHFGFFQLQIKSIQIHKIIGLSIVFLGIIIFSYKDFKF